MKYTLRYLDTCHPDYFNGSRNETLIAPYWRGQTIAEALRKLELWANNESREPFVYEAIHNYLKQWGENKGPILNKTAESYIECHCDQKDCECEMPYHYFEVIKKESEE